MAVSITETWAVVWGFVAAIVDRRLLTSRRFPSGVRAANAGIRPTGTRAIWRRPAVSITETSSEMWLAT